MNTTPSPNREQSPTRSKTAGSSGGHHRKKSNDSRARTPRSPFVPPTQATKLYRHNKLYRCPPTPPPEVQFERERSFILDCQAVSNISRDYSTANPKLGSAIPPYIAQHHVDVDNYFDFFGVKSTLKKTSQYNDPESIAGRVHDRFHSSGHGFRYLSHRNKFGSGHSIEQIRGHELFLSDPKPVVNYNGLFGYRRNTPSLRQQPTIGTRKLDANGYVPLGRYSSIGCGSSYSFHCPCKFDQPCRCHNQNKLCPCVKA